MALQELDLAIVHRSGKCNSNADALSRCPLLHSADPESTCELVAALTAGDGTERDNIGDGDLKDRQRADEGLAPVIDFLERGLLPKDEWLSRRIALASSQYTIQDQVLYRVEADGTLRMIPPESSRRQLFSEAHCGRFGAHLSDSKVFSELRRHC